MEIGGEESGAGSEHGSTPSGKERDGAWKAGEPRIQGSLCKVGKGPWLAS